ncbi:hypothetical protein OSCT_0913 [Oscillochloris trichoides DG-6]|uniref:Uncharacterized protein n=1 Tax=Oscillochloris trichoides DG-6 TaxID=765420 RepID=E1IC62_9CHLR|nr:hypothetical protein OSCT_0913 [Oscillochloris trichoides DG-6]
MQPPDHSPADLHSTSLSDLHQQCEAQLAAFRRSRNTQQDSSSCEEILRRAANRDGDDAAFSLLWHITTAFVRQTCPPQCRPFLEDIEQEVGLRLFRRLRLSPSPYQAGSFAGYRLYVNLTIKNVCTNLHRSHDIKHASLEFHPNIPSPSMTKEVLRHMLFNRCEALLPHALHREIFRRRMVQHEEVADIVAALKDRYPEITRNQVYRIIEDSVRRLKSDPEVREMFESMGENE